MAYCKDCGQRVGADGKFCESCGSRLSGSVCATKEPEGSSLAELVTYPCAYCGGTGEVDVGEIVPVYDTCSVCKGACEVRVPGDYVECRACEGTGEEDVGDVLEVFEPCGRCKGTGWATPPVCIGRRVLSE